MLLHNSNSKSEALGPRSTGCTSTTPRACVWLAAAKGALADARFAAMIAHQEAGEARDDCAAAQARLNEALKYFEDGLAEVRSIASTL